MNVTERETWKCGLLDLQLSKKVLTLSCVAFSGRVRLPVCAKEFKESYM
jgi:hypothetical protein